MNYDKRIRILLARHGNTFNPDDKVVWVGSQNDLKLVEKGRLQAKHLGDVLKEKKILPSYIYTSPLLRTHEYAQIICNCLQKNLTPIICKYLIELDYGMWTNKSNQEIKELFGEKVLEQWEISSIIPSKEHGDWKEDETSLINGVKTFLKEIIDSCPDKETILAITSNGKLRFFIKYLQSFNHCKLNNNLKVKTGNICELIYSKDNYEVKSWDINPIELSTEW